jgi:hypothetical protein
MSDVTVSKPVLSIGKKAPLTLEAYRQKIGLAKPVKGVVPEQHRGQVHSARHHKIELANDARGGTQEVHRGGRAAQPQNHIGAVVPCVRHAETDPHVAAGLDIAADMVSGHHLEISLGLDTSAAHADVGNGDVNPPCPRPSSDASRASDAGPARAASPPKTRPDGPRPFTHIDVYPGEPSARASRIKAMRSWSSEVRLTK